MRISECELLKQLETGQVSADFYFKAFEVIVAKINILLKCAVELKKDDDTRRKADLERREMEELG